MWLSEGILSSDLEEFFNLNIDLKKFNFTILRFILDEICINISKGAGMKLL